MFQPWSRPVCIAFLAVAALSAVKGQTGQPKFPSTGPGTFDIIGRSGVNAQMLFLGTPTKMYIVDKVENNPLQINGHPAWAAEYDLETNQVRAMDVITNTFCAGGNVLGDGRWINVGGNQRVTYGGLTATNDTGNPYGNTDGRFAVRFLTPCDDFTCDWVDDPKDYMTTTRWYPTIETLEDGSAIIIGGNQYGGFVSAQDNNNPTYEYYPRKGAPITLNLLLRTLPANLYPLTWLLPSGNLFIQTNLETEIFDYKDNKEYPLPNIPYAVRTYPGSGATAMLPLTPGNNWTATMLFCGGTDLQPKQWRTTIIINVPADASCVRMTPDVSTKWEDDDSLPEGRSMGNFVFLPTGKLLLVNGANQGTAGYGNESWAEGHSYATEPLMTPLLYDPYAPKGSRFTRDGLSTSTIPRMYHSVASLLPDGSVFVSGSNPNPDVTYDKWPTEYRVERFYPSYYASPRPEIIGLPKTLGYGGSFFNLTFTNTDLGASPGQSLSSAKVVLMRFGFSTHAINFGQRWLQLNNTFTLDASNTATLHVAQAPPNPAIFPPGPAWIFVVVNGIPSIGQPILLGSGKIEVQKVTTPQTLPGTYVAQPPTSHDNTASNGLPGSSSSAITFVADLGLLTFATAIVIWGPRF